MSVEIEIIPGSDEEFTDATDDDKKELVDGHYGRGTPRNIMYLLLSILMLTFLPFIVIDVTLCVAVFIAHIGVIVYIAVALMCTLHVVQFMLLLAIVYVYVSNDGEDNDE